MTAAAEMIDVTTNGCHSNGENSQYHADYSSASAERNSGEPFLTQLAAHDQMQISLKLFQRFQIIGRWNSRQKTEHSRTPFENISPASQMNQGKSLILTIHRKIILKIPKCYFMIININIFINLIVSRHNYTLTEAHMTSRVKSQQDKSWRNV